MPLLGQVPLDTALREGGDDGVPIVLSAPDTPAAKVLRTVADQLAGKPRGLAGMSLSLTPTSRDAEGFIPTAIGDPEEAGAFGCPPT